MTKIIEMTGKRFGRLTVIGEAGRHSNGNAVWLCECDCGNRVKVEGHALRKGITRSCGCLRRENSMRLIRTNAETRRHIGDNSGLRTADGIYKSALVVSRRNSSGVVGVSFDQTSQRWIARMMFRGRLVLNASFATRAEAVVARQKAEQRYF